MAKVKVKFDRGLENASPQELEALSKVPGLGFIYPGDRLNQARLEAEMTRPNVPTTHGTVTVFFRLIDTEGAENIEIVEQLYPRVWNYAGWVWPSADKRANVTIEDVVVNGHYVLSSLIDGQTVNFAYDSGEYVAPGALRRNRSVRSQAA